MALKPVDTAIKVIVGPLIDDTDFKSREEAIAYNAAGMEIDVILEKSDGTVTTTAVTPTTAGNYDWAHTDQGYYELEIPASGGADYNNDSEGILTVVGFVTGVLPFRSIGAYDVVPVKVYNSLVADSDNLEVDQVQLGGDTQSTADLKDFADDGYDPATNKVQGVVLVDTTTTNSDVRGTDGAALASVCTEARLAELDAGNLPTDVANVQTEVDKIGTIPALDGATQDIGAALAKLADDNAGADFDATTDSLQAIRDRGDAAWTTGAGGSDRLLMVDTTIATLASQTSFTLTAGSADDKAYENCTIVIEDASTATQKAVGLVFAYTGSTKTVTLKYDPGVFTMAATDKVYVLAENALKSTEQNRQLDVTATGGAGIDWANVESQGTAVDLSATDIQLCDTTTAVTNTVNANAVSAIAAFFQDCFTVDSGEVSGAEVSGSLILEIAKVIWDRALTAATHNDPTSAGRRLRQVETIFVLDTGTAQAGASGSITLAAGADANDDFYLHTMIVITGGTGIGQVRAIQAYNGTTKVATTVPDWVVNPDVTSTYEILADTLKHVFEVEAGGITAASFATDAVDANALAASAVAEIAATIGPNVYGADCYYVDDDRADDTGDGLTWATAKKTIGAAVGVASSGDTLLIGKGNYAETSTITIAAGNSLRMIGSGEGITNLDNATTFPTISVSGVLETRGMFIDGNDGNGVSVYLNHANARVRAYDCRFESDDVGVQIDTGGVAMMYRCYADTLNDSLFLSAAGTALFSDGIITGDADGVLSSGQILVVDTLLDCVDSDLRRLAGNLYAFGSGYDSTSGTIISEESKATDALISLNLDHLAKVATAAADMTAEVVDNTILSRILANGDTSAFTPSTDGLQPIRDQGDAAWITATGFSTHAAADVWAVVTRVLTANTNFNDPSAAAIVTAIKAALYDGVSFESVQECLLAVLSGQAVPHLTQHATITGSPTGGTFTLTLAGQETGAIAYDATAATVEAAIEALSNVGAGNGTTSGNAGGPWTVVFTGLDTTDLAAMTADGSGLTGGTSPDVEIDTTVSYRKRDGSTSKMTVRYTTAEGERAGSTIDN